MHLLWKSIAHVGCRGGRAFPEPAANVRIDGLQRTAKFDLQVLFGSVHRHGDYLGSNACSAGEWLTKTTTAPKYRRRLHTETMSGHLVAGRWVEMARVTGTRCWLRTAEKLKAPADMRLCYTRRWQEDRR